MSVNELPVSEISYENKDVIKLLRGQRISLNAISGKTIAIEYSDAFRRLDADIDGYVFRLMNNGKVRNDDDIIFFGNENQSGNDIRMDKDIVYIELKNVPQQIERLAVCYSVYGDALTNNFSLTKEPKIKVLSEGREKYRFDLTDLNGVKTIVALEIYRFKGEWKMNLVGSGYRDTLKSLCEGYGVNVV